MANQSNSFDLREVFDELKNFVRQQGGELRSRKQPAPDATRVDLAVLVALETGAKNSHEIVESIGLASAGAWSPSAAAVRESLERLVEAEHVTARTKGDRKVYKITEAGTTWMKTEAKTAKPAGSAETGRSGGPRITLPFDPNFAANAYKLTPVLLDIAQTGSKAQQQRATEILEATRKQLHKILADD